MFLIMSRTFSLIFQKLIPLIIIILWDEFVVVNTSVEASAQLWGRRNLWNLHCWGDPFLQIRIKLISAYVSVSKKTGHSGSNIYINWLKFNVFCMVIGYWWKGVIKPKDRKREGKAQKGNFPRIYYYYYYWEMPLITNVVKICNLYILQYMAAESEKLETCLSGYRW